MDLSPDVKRKMQRLVKRTGCGTLVELIRRAVALYDLATEHQADGGKLVFRHADGREEVLKLLP